jgi:trimethylamine--corrinoid protein Co-methyltransferase
MDGEGPTVLDRKTGKHRDSTFHDWIEATRLADALDDIGIYWRIVVATDRGDTILDYVDYLLTLFRNFSKHIQDPIYAKKQAPWYQEVLQTIFGSKETIRQKHPVSYVLCPQSPLVIDEIYTDAYLELVGWNIPVAVMPMPLMGATAPASLISTVITANCEVLATLCLIQAAEPGAPVIYAPVSALMDPRTGMLKSDAIESGVLSAMPSILSWPDILVGAGLLGGAMILSLEQMLIDTETLWLDDVLDQVGPGGQFWDQVSTTTAIRDGEWYLSKKGMMASLEEWKAAGKRELVEDAREKVNQILSSHEPLPLDEDIDRELERIKIKAAESLS